MFNRIGLFFNNDKYLYTGIIEMTTEFFRKFADMITEAEQVQVRKFAQNRDAERYVMKLCSQGKDIAEILADPAVAQSNLSDDTIKLIWANQPDED